LSAKGFGYPKLNKKLIQEKVSLLTSEAWPSFWGMMRDKVTKDLEITVSNV